MARLNITLSDGLNDRLRESAYRWFGESKGSLQRAIEESITLWLQLLPEDKASRDFYRAAGLLDKNDNLTEFGKRVLLRPTKVLSALVDLMKTDKEMQRKVMARLVASDLASIGHNLPPEVIESFLESKMKEKSA